MKIKIFYLSLIIIISSCSKNNFTSNNDSKNVEQEKTIIPAPTSTPNITPTAPNITPTIPVNTCANKNIQIKNKKILIYAPDNYKYDINKFGKDLKDHLVSKGYTIDYVNTVNKFTKYDECNLQTNFKQIWLLLPCNNSQVMDVTSYNAVKKFYEFGGKLVLMTDNHYYDNNEPNTHCEISNWGGTKEKPSDSVKIAENILGVNIYKSTKIKDSNKYINESQIDMSSLLGKDFLNTIKLHKMTQVYQWSDIYIDLKNNKNAKYLPWYYGDKYAPFVVVIEKNLPAKSIAFIFSSIYNYHQEIRGTKDLLTIIDIVAAQ